MRALFFLLIALFQLCSLAGPALADRPTVLVIPKEDLQFWDTVQQGAIQAGSERGVNIVFRGPASSTNLKAQLDIIQAGIDNNVEAIVLAPSHTSLATPLLEEAHKKGIKIVIIDSDMDFKDRVTFVASDNYKAGEKAASYLLSLIKNGETILFVRYRNTNNSTEQREKGFLEFMQKNGAGRIKMETVYMDGTIGGAFHHVNEALLPPTRIKAIFSTSESATLGSLRALHERGIAGKVKFVCFDFPQELRVAMGKNEIDGTIVQDPYHMGYLGVMAACDALEGQVVKKRIFTKTELITSLDQISTLED